MTNISVNNSINNNINIGVIACDSRQLYTAKLLAESGYNVYLVYSNIFETEKSFKNTLCEMAYDSKTNNIKIQSSIFDLIEVSDVIVGPVPMNKISEFMILPKFISILKEQGNNKLLFAGMIDDATVEVLNASNIKIIDYIKSEKLTTYNTIATAEGIIAEAIINKNTNLHMSKSLILGFGKCAKTLAHKLAGLSADITVAARNSIELANAYSLGYKTMYLSTLKDTIGHFDFIFNTIPAQILNADLIKNINKSSLILDIASIPGGVDKNAALERGLSVIHSLGIPGKYSPKSSGEAIGEYLIDIISKYSLHKLNM